MGQHMSNELVETDLRNYLAAQDGDYVLTYDALIEAERKREIAVEPKSTGNSRVAKWRKALEKRDKSVLRAAYDRMRGYVAQVRSNLDILLEETPGVLTYDDAKKLAQQFVDMREIEAALKVDRSLIRDRVFASMTEDLAAQGVEQPEHVSAQIEFPELGIYFDRYGCGRTDPELDEARLRTELGEEVWAKVTRAEHIPARVDYKLDHDALMELARTNPELAVLEKVRSSLKQGEWKNPSLTVRNL
jgi:hypothetical protein